MKQTQTAAFGVPEYEPKREGTYRPRIQPDQLRQLWLLKQETGKPMTALVREALESYLTIRSRQMTTLSSSLERR